MIWLRRSALAILVGAMAGLSATIFLFVLGWATAFRESHPLIIFGLPLAGFFVAWLYHRYGRDALPGTALVVDQIHEPRQVLPPAMAPLIFLGTIVTHLFGGSAGREGTAVQMGAGLADQLTPVFDLRSAERRALLMAGMGAGFGAAVGAPIAGAIFGVEVIRTRARFRFAAIVECAVASATGYLTTWALRAPHAHYPRNVIPGVEVRLLLEVAIVGLAFGLSAHAFIWLTHQLENLEKRYVPHAVYRPLLAGLVLCALYACLGQRYAGLGLEVIESALESPAPWFDPLFKAGFTILTIASGFKGGEFIPLVFIGATLGSAAGNWLHPEYFTVFASVGFAAVFGAAARTPLATAVMAAEIFGLELLPYALVAGYAAYFVSDAEGIYRRLPLPTT